MNIKESKDSDDSGSFGNIEDLQSSRVLERFDDNGRFADSANIEYLTDSPIFQNLDMWGGGSGPDNLKGWCNNRGRGMEAVTKTTSVLEKTSRL